LIGWGGSDGLETTPGPPKTGPSHHDQGGMENWGNQHYKKKKAKGQGRRKLPRGGRQGCFLCVQTPSPVPGKKGERGENPRKRAKKSTGPKMRPQGTDMTEPCHHFPTRKRGQETQFGKKKNGSSGAGRRERGPPGDLFVQGPTVPEKE